MDKKYRVINGVKYYEHDCEHAINLARAIRNGAKIDDVQNVVYNYSVSKAAEVGASCSSKYAAAYTKKMMSLITLFVQELELSSR